MNVESTCCCWAQRHRWGVTAGQARESQQQVPAALLLPPLDPLVSPSGRTERDLLAKETPGLHSAQKGHQSGVQTGECKAGKRRPNSRRSHRWFIPPSAPSSLRKPQLAARFCRTPTRGLKAQGFPWKDRQGGPALGLHVAAPPSSREASRRPLGTAPRLCSQVSRTSPRTRPMSVPTSDLAGHGPAS